MTNEQKEVVHKRDLDRKKNGAKTWTRCDPKKSFSGSRYSYLYTPFYKWENKNKYHWKYVTCKKCLELK